MILEVIDEYKKELINKGFSSEEKYKITKGTKKYLLKITPNENKETKKLEQKYYKSFKELSCCKLLELEFGENNIKSIYSWIDGKDFREIQEEITPQQFYTYGNNAGKILRAIHSLKIDEKVTDWQQKMNEKIDKKIENYEKISIVYPKGRYFVEYLNKNRELLFNRPLSLCHGDFHVGNMMIDDKTNRLVVIDFGTLEINDPYEEFNRMVWNALVSHNFATGVIEGYFEDEKIPNDFWKLMKLYIAMDVLSSLSWANNHSEEQLNFMKNRADKVLSWYDDFAIDVPKFYKRG